jgi:hypothetical protein
MMILCQEKIAVKFFFAVKDKTGGYGLEFMRAESYGLLIVTGKMYNGLRSDLSDVVSRLDRLCCVVVCKGVLMKKVSLLLCFVLCAGQSVAEEAVAKEVHPAISSESAPHYYYEPRRTGSYSDCSEDPYVYYNPEPRRRVVSRRRQNRVPSHQVRRRQIRTVSPALTAESAPHYYYKEPVERRVKAPDPCTYESHYVKEVNGGTIRYVMNGRVKVCEPGTNGRNRGEIGNYNWGWSHSSPDYYKKPLFIGDNVINNVEPVAVRERYLRDRFSGKRVRDDYYY